MSKNRLTTEKRMEFHFDYYGEASGEMLCNKITDISGTIESNILPQISPVFPFMQSTTDHNPVPKWHKPLSQAKREAVRLDCLLFLLAACGGWDLCGESFYFDDRYFLTNCVGVTFIYSLNCLLKK